MKYSLTAFIFCLFIVGCNQNGQRSSWRNMTQAQRAKRIDSLKSELLNADIAFSQLSEEKGRNAAFIEYADSEAILLRAFSMPVKGLDSIMNMLNAHPDSAITLSLIPIYADVALSGDLGYTYGTYSVAIKDSGSMEGTYCSVWIKDRNKKWKFLLRSGNHGLRPEDRKGEK